MVSTVSMKSVTVAVKTGCTPPVHRPIGRKFPGKYSHRHRHRHHRETPLSIGNHLYASEFTENHRYITATVTGTTVITEDGGLSPYQVQVLAERNITNINDRHRHPRQGPCGPSTCKFRVEEHERYYLQIRV